MHLAHSNHITTKITNFKKQLVRKIVISGAVCAVLSCSGCSYLQKETPTVHKQQFYKKPTLNVPSTSNRIAQLQQQHITVIHQGANWRFILPIRHVFIGLTQKIQLQQIQSLKYIAAYIRENPNASIRVSGYSNSITHNKTSKQQSLQYAQTIASYLWHYGIAWKKMTIQGLGNTDSVASNNNPAGASANNRVEVSIKNY